MLRAALDASTPAVIGSLATTTIASIRWVPLAGDPDDGALAHLEYDEPPSCLENAATPVLVRRRWAADAPALLREHRRIPA